MDKYQVKALLEKFDEGNCTAEELALLEEWYLNWRQTPVHLTQEQIDESLDRIWNRLQHARKKPVKLYNLRSVIRSIAAILVLAIGISLYFYRYQSVNKHVTEETVNDIEPGSNKAWIVLADGRKIDLSKDKTGVKVLKGQLTYNDGSKLLDEPELINQPVTLQTPRGGTYQVQLPDGTEVWLNAATKLIYYPVLSNKGKRIVDLEGEAYFEVAKDKAHPFIVQSKAQVVEVLGTHFNISSYPDDMLSKTTLLEGRIKINHNMLLPGQQAILKDKNLSIQQADTEHTMAWKNGDFVFKGENFKEMMQKIARWYDVQIEYSENVATDQVELAGWISRKSKLSEVLNRIQRAGKIHFKIEGRKIIVEKQT